MLIKEFQEHSIDFMTYLDVERNLTKNTQRSYQSDFDLFKAFWARINTTEKEPLALRPALERYFVSLYHKNIDKSSIARKISCFTSFQRFLKKTGIPLELNLQRPRIDKKLPTYLSIDEIFYLLDTLPEEQLPTKRPIRDKTIFELLYATGIRCSELCLITFKDIDLENKLIRITGKGRKERLVLFGQKAQERIKLYLAKERSLPTDTKEALFVNYCNKPLTTRSIQRIIQMFRIFLKGKKNITPHKLRHSFATHLLNQGVNVRIVQELLGHQTLASTEKYTHVSQQELSDMCDAFHPLSTMKPTTNHD